jgi:hypothetical protein
MLPPLISTTKAPNDVHFGAHSRSFGTCCPTLRVSRYHSRARLASGWLAGLYREGVEPSGSLRKVSGHMAILLSCSPDAMRSAPDCRSRRAILHLSYSCAAPCGPALLRDTRPHGCRSDSGVTIMARATSAQLAFFLPDPAAELAVKEHHVLLDGLTADVQAIGGEVRVGVANRQAAQNREFRRDSQLRPDRFRIPRD